MKMENQTTPILVVEDDASHAELLCRHFEPHADRFELTVAHSLGKAKKYLAESKPALVITDVFLPDGEGTELLRLNNGSSPYPLLMMTGRGDEQMAVNAIKAGALGYVAKSETSFAEMPLIVRRALREWDHITERKRMERALKQSEERFKALTENTTDVTVILDDKFCYRYVSPAVKKIFATSPDKLIGKSAISSIHPDDLMLIRKAVERSMRHPGETINVEVFRARHKNGSWVSLAGLFTCLSDVAGVQGIVGNFRDITEKIRAQEKQRELERQLLEARKTEAIATLAGGVAHEFNNALAGLGGYMELLQMERSGEEKITKYLGNMEESTHRMVKLTRQLLAYSRGGLYHPETVIFREFLKCSLRLIRHGIPATIRVEQDFPNNNLEINADLTQVQTVISAVVENSVEAIEGEGHIRITFDQEEIDETDARNHLALKPGCYVCLTIEDDGRGMDEETRNKIFEPFFTTKFQGRGLAMAAAFGIVKNHEGWISVFSELGEGTAVRIYLPALEGTKL